MRLESGPKEGPDHEAIEVQRGADHRVLREQEAGVSTADVCRKHGISSATFYAWKAKFGGMDVSEAKRLKALEDENAKLKRLLADAMLDNVALKDLLTKNVMVRPVGARISFVLTVPVCIMYGPPRRCKDQFSF